MSEHWPLAFAIAGLNDNFDTSSFVQLMERDSRTHRTFVISAEGVYRHVSPFLSEYWASREKYLRDFRDTFSALNIFPAIFFR